MGERGQLRRWPNRAGNKTRLCWSRKLSDSLARQLHCRVIDLCDAILQSKFAEHDVSRAEGVGLNNIGAHTQVLRVNVANHFRTAEVQNLAAVFLAPEILERRIHVLNER